VSLTVYLAIATLLVLPRIATVGRGVQKRAAMARRIGFLKTCSSLLPSILFTRAVVPHCVTIKRLCGRNAVGERDLRSLNTWVI